MPYNAVDFKTPPTFWEPWHRSGANREKIERQSAGGGAFGYFAFRHPLTLPIPDSHASFWAFGRGVMRPILANGSV
jgi:hypothetical protein